jgi:hypothetical protein
MLSWLQVFLLSKCPAPKLSCLLPSCPASKLPCFQVVLAFKVSQKCQESLWLSNGPKYLWPSCDSKSLWLSTGPKYLWSSHCPNIYGPSIDQNALTLPPSCPASKLSCFQVALLLSCPTSVQNIYGSLMAQNIYGPPMAQNIYGPLWPKMLWFLSIRINANNNTNLKKRELEALKLKKWKKNAFFS